MKYLYGILLIFLISWQHNYAQRNQHHGRGMLEQLEKAKLIETLNLDEETSVRFFARRAKHMEKTKKLIKQRENILSEIGDKIRAEDFDGSDSLINKVFKIEKNILVSREQFIRSLGDILTHDQIVKLIFFDYRFKKEMRNFLLERGRKNWRNRRKF